MDSNESEWIEWVSSEKSRLPLAEPNILLLSKIRSTIIREETVSKKWVFIAAFSLMLLTAINIRLLISHKAINKPHQEFLLQTPAQNNNFY